MHLPTSRRGLRDSPDCEGFRGTRKKREEQEHRRPGLCRQSFLSQVNHLQGRMGKNDRGVLEINSSRCPRPCHDFQAAFQSPLNLSRGCTDLFVGGGECDFRRGTEGFPETHGGKMVQEKELRPKHPVYLPCVAPFSNCCQSRSP